MSLKIIRFLWAIALLTLLSCAHGPSVPERGEGFLPDPPPTSRGPSSENATCLEILRYLHFSDFSAVRGNYEQALRSYYGARDAELAKDNIEALYFVDFNHAYDQLSKIRYDGVSLTEGNLDIIYRHGRALRRKNTPFKNHQAALRQLQDSEGEFSASLLKRTHKKLMAGGVDGLRENLTGTYRKINIIGNAEDFPVPERGYLALEENPYISTDSLRRVTRNQGGESFVEYRGQILYPSPDSITPHVREIVAQRDPELLAALNRYQSGQGGSNSDLNEKLMNVLVEDLMEWFVRQRDQIGNITTDAKFRRYIRTVAEFQRNLISIHPFQDGNGRTSRVFALYYPFLKENLPPPRLVNPNADIERTLDEWVEQIAQGIEATKGLYEDLTKRAQLGMPLEQSPNLVAPLYPRRATVGFRQQTPSRSVADYKQLDVNSQEFAEHMSIVVDAEPTMARLLDEEPDLFFNEMATRHLEFMRRNRLFYVHPRQGEHQVALHLADLDFIQSFADQSFRNAEQWTAKMDSFYDKQVVWRGLANRSRETTEDELLNMFVEPNSHFVSNNVARQLTNRTTPEKMTELIINDFVQYNHDVVYDGLVRMARDHSETGPLYGQSYGYSTSKNRTVGKAFAMGAMVVAEYGQHQAHQHLLKSRVLVGMKKSKKDVDLTRLRQVRDDFSYRYGRQQEVMGIGGADPDSVMFVQTIDENGDVILSYVRNPENPAEIFVLRGEYSEWPVARNSPDLERIIELD